MKKLIVEILSAGKDLEKCFIDIIDPAGVLLAGRKITLSGVALSELLNLTGMTICDDLGSQVECRITLDINAPGMGSLFPEIAHSGKSRFKIEDIPPERFERSCIINASFGYGPSVAIARVDAFDVLDILTDDRRMPTKRSSLRFLRQNGVTVGTVLDIGVQHKTKELMDAFPDHKHLLFEPVEESYPYIEKNYQSFDYELVKAAVSNTDGEGQLEVRTRAEGSHFLTSTVVHAATPAQNAGMIATSTRKVRKITLDSYLARKSYETPFLLKLDVDGNELDILQGASETLKSTSCVIVEVALSNLFERGQFLIDKGFVLWDIVDLGYYRDNLYHADLVFVSKEQKALPAFSPWQRLPFDESKITTFLH